MKTPKEFLEQFGQCKSICRNFPYPIIAVTDEGVILDGCDDIHTILGKTLAELHGKKISELPIFPKESSVELDAMIKRAFGGEISTRGNIGVLIGGVEVKMEVVGNIVTENGATVLFLIFQDSNCVHETQKELEESRLKYRTLFENMRSGVAVYQAVNDGEDFIITEFNKVAEDSDRLSKKDVLGKNIKEVFPGIEKIGFLDVLRRVWKTGTPEVFPPTVYEDQRVGKVWWEDYIYKLPSGEIVAAFANITEHLKALEDLKKTMNEVVEERNKIQTIVQSIGDGVFVISREGMIELFNEAASQISGVPQQEALGKKYTDVLKFRYEGSQREVVGFADEVLKTGVVVKGEHDYVLVNRDGDQIPVSHSISPMRGGDGVHGVVVVLRDMTNEREVDRLKTEFVSIASHQMHTPLMGMKWFLEVLLRGKAGVMPPEQKKYVEQIYASNDRMISIVEDLLFASRVNAGDKYTVAKEPVDIVELIDETVKQNFDLIEKNKIVIVKSDMMPQHLTLSVDVQMMKRIFYNLISNACKYSKPLGTVELGCDQSKTNEVVFYVKDNGYGIPQRQQSRIFERFFRGDNVVTKVNEGTGLGLFIIKTLAEAHGGRIWFESLENFGTTFYISIPKESDDKKRKRSGTSRSEAFKASLETETSNV